MDNKDKAYSEENKANIKKAILLGKQAMALLDSAPESYFLSWGGRVVKESPFGDINYNLSESISFYEAALDQLNEKK